MNQTTPPLTLHFGSALSPDEMARQALEAFDALTVGEHISLVLTRTPRELLARFQAERKGEFDWTPTSEGPETFLVEVSRRRGERGSLRTVNDALSWDHDRLDALEARAFKAREAGGFSEARAIYSTFAAGLRRHIRFEEEILFPEFETRAGFPSAAGPTAVMRDEHREILSLLEQIEQAIGDGASRAESVRHGFHAVLGNHNLKEENIVYPGTDRALTALERDALVARIQAM